MDAEPYRTLRRRLAAGTLSHAFLLCGGAWEDRLQLANWLAAARVCTAPEDVPCGHCAACRKAAEGIHPDIMTVDGEPGKSMTAAQAREVRADAFILPNEARRKVYLFPHADLMNLTAQNALLKVLEEGPPYAFFLFLSESREKLLPTVQSRCESILLSGEREETRSGNITAEADSFADKLLWADPLSLLEAGVPLEKMDRDEFDGFLGGVMEALSNRLPEHPAQVLPLLEKLGKIRAALGFYVGVGHLTGWLVVRDV
ncbi:MAG: polymerase subunit delta [Oscillospiraceae bacterium]|nr:polymerase subunit delta [Oscillospiraceae bacterium]